MRAFSIVVFLFVETLAKDLHFKEDTQVATTEYILTEGDNRFQDIYGYDEVFYDAKERHARHIELVTESALEHLLTEIKNKYPTSKNDTNRMPNIMKRLQMKLKQLKKRKHKKHVKTLHRKSKISHTKEPETTSSIL